ncbi:hypothetical protein niasHS_002514 [Heterodera schachtii]|uniref:CUE domain-containing protein n=1 Tax=Heterodera schachtii TaxID=97005 RepID=A0ABD2KKM8_HETSC
MNLEDVLQLLEKASSQSSKLEKSLIETPKISGLFAEILDLFLVELTNLFTSMCFDLNKSRTLNSDDQATLCSIVKCVPYLITVIWKLLSSSNLCKICASIQKCAQLCINKLSARRSKIIQTAVEFVVCFYQAFASLEFKFKFVQDNVDRSEFIVRLDDRIKLEDEFDKFVAGRICTDFQRMSMKRALETAYEVKRHCIRDTLAKQRMFEFIGHPKERVIADQLQELADIMPDLSKQQLHLCLRHFGYDLEQTLANLCERDKLPLDLKIILRITDSFDDVPFFEKKQLPMADDGCVFADNANGVAIVPSSPPTPFEIGTNCGGFNLEKLREAMFLLEKADDEVEVGGKVLVRQQFREQRQTEEETSKLRAVNLRFVKEMEERDDEQPDSDGEADETRKDERMAEEVGQSGRFNRPGLSAAMDPYEDEYDDTFEHALLYSQVDGGATTAADEKEATEAKGTRKHLTEGAQNTAKGGKMGSREKQTPRQEANTSAKAKETTKKANDSSAYTGGRERQLKERNKGKERQKGADKKAKKTQFF